MRILVLHNRYRTPGGEDVVVAAEVSQLRACGHEVTLIEVENAEIAGPIAKARAAIGTPYRAARRAWARKLVDQTEAQVVHIHNFFPLLSPGVVDGARDAGAAVVQTLHNYRAICANGLLMRDGAICERCVGHIGWPALRYRCYRDSLAGSAAVVAMQQLILRGRIWDRPGTRLVALTGFARDKLIEGGLPRHRIVVKPNFIAPVVANQAAVGRDGILFVGRLSREKGLDTLLEAARILPHRRFTAIGGGDDARWSVTAPANIAFTGALPGDEARDHIARAAVLALPSVWYEGFPMALLEAFARATPVVASRIGSLAELVNDGVTGRLVPPGDAAALATAIEALLVDPVAAARIGEASQSLSRAHYDPESNIAMLEAIYADAIAEAKR